MTTSVPDVHARFNKLREAGFTDEQTKAIIDLVEALPFSDLVLQSQINRR